MIEFVVLPLFWALAIFSIYFDTVLVAFLYFYIKTNNERYDSLHDYGLIEGLVEMAKYDWNTMKHSWFWPRHVRAWYINRK